MSSARAQRVLEDFEYLKKEANDLKKRIGDKYRFLNFIQNRIDTAIATIEVRRIQFSTKLNKFLQGQASEGFDAVVDDLTAPPFDAKGISNMLDSIEREASTLSQFFSLIRIADPARKRADPARKHADTKTTTKPPTKGELCTMFTFII